MKKTFFVILLVSILTPTKLLSFDSRIKLQLESGRFCFEEATKITGKPIVVKPILLSIKPNKQKVRNNKILLFSKTGKTCHSLKNACGIYLKKSGVELELTLTRTRKKCPKDYSCFEVDSVRKIGPKKTRKIRKPLVGYELVVGLDSTDNYFCSYHEFPGVSGGL